jgi:2-polyprenyl-3-methyl-5-hydroxy-6-metoxy-1,4-benzoquinol methylase
MLWLDRLSRRERVAERMDDPRLDAGEHQRALAGLARLNRLSRSAELFWPEIARLARAHPGQPLRVLDLATGTGDIPLRLAEKARGHGYSHLEFHGCDISPTAVAEAQKAAASTGLPVTFFPRNILNDPFDQSYDIVTCSLFLHHLSHDDAICVLRRMNQLARRRILVNDLVRSPGNWLLVWLACRLVSRSSVVHFDGPASVRSAFTATEIQTLAEQAGIPRVRVISRPPCRFLLIGK